MDTKSLGREEPGTGVHWAAGTRRVGHLGWRPAASGSTQGSVCSKLRAWRHQPERSIETGEGPEGNWGPFSHVENRTDVISKEWAAAWET